MTAAIKAALEAGRIIMEIYTGSELTVRHKSDDTPITVADLRAHRSITRSLEDTGLPVLSEEGRDIPFGERVDWGLFWLVDPLDGTKGFINNTGDFTVNIALIDRQDPVAGVVYDPVNDILYAGVAGMGAWRVDKASGLDGAAAGVSLETLDSAGKRLPCVTHKNYGVVGSRAYMDDLTRHFIEGFVKKYPGTRVIIRGSSLKLCMIAEGEADLYPRFSNISEWDTAAGHAIVVASGGSVLQAPGTDRPLVYNKETSINPWFIAFRDKKLLDAVKGMIPLASSTGGA